jgi:HSP20 family protein
MPAPPARRPDQSQRADPLRELDDLRSQLDRVLHDTVVGAYSEGAWAPPVDIEETDDAWLVEADLPGVERDDISVELHDGQLAIHGELTEKERVGILRRRTRRTGRFDYRVQLAGDLDPDAVQAQLTDGILHVRLPKPARSKPRRIQIKG